MRIDPQLLGLVHGLLEQVEIAGSQRCVDGKRQSDTFFRIGLSQHLDIVGGLFESAALAADFVMEFGRTVDGYADVS